MCAEENTIPVLKEALEASGCVERMTVLSFFSCEMDIEGARTLADLLRRDRLPALENLCLSFNRETFIEQFIKGLLRIARRTASVYVRQGIPLIFEEMPEEANGL